jgi:hypothetical protein
MAHAEGCERVGGPQAAVIAPVGARQCCVLDWPGLAAFAVYLGLAVLFFARGLFGRFSTAYIGKDVDPQLLMWLMAWWPHAIRHGLNPLHTRAVWAPHGVNLAWTTCMPLLSLVLAPVVIAMGPVFAYNLSCLLAVALAGWCAFILCRYVSGAYWPSLIGGYVFGFSAYMLGQAAAHLDLLLVFPAPLFAWLLIRGFRADISQRAFAAGLVIVLTAEFLLFVELFATMTLFAAIALLTLLVVGSRAEKARAVALLPTVALSYAIVALLLSPYLYCMVALGYEPGASHPPLLYSTDILNLFIPTATMELGHLAQLRAITGRFLGYIYEAGGYIGIPLMLIVAAFARRRSLGPFLIVAGRPLLLAPGAVLLIVPLIGKALPARLMLYAFLALAPMTAMWLSASAAPGWIRLSVATAAVFLMLPNLSARFWTTAIDLPPFFRDGLYTKYLARGETVVVLPYGYNGNSMFWQLESNWYFRMAGGNVGPPPLGFRRWPAVRAFYRLDTVALPAAGDQLRAFLAAHHATAILVDDRKAELWRPLMVTLGVTPVRAGGMTIYRVPPAELAPWTNVPALEMAARADRARFAALLLATEAWLHTGHSPASFTPGEVLKAQALPPGWVVVPRKIQPPFAEGGINLPRRSPNPHLFAEMWLSEDERGRVKIGVEGWYPALRAVLNEYRADAIDFVPRDLARAPQGAADDRFGKLVMTFNAEGLERAAERAASPDFALAHSGAVAGAPRGAGGAAQ